VGLAIFKDEGLLVKPSEAGDHKVLVRLIVDQHGVVHSVDHVCDKDGRHLVGQRFLENRLESFNRELAILRVQDGEDAASCFQTIARRK